MGMQRKKTKAEAAKRHAKRGGKADTAEAAKRSNGETDFAAEPEMKNVRRGSRGSFTAPLLKRRRRGYDDVTSAVKGLRMQLCPAPSRAS